MKTGLIIGSIIAISLNVMANERIAVEYSEPIYRTYDQKIYLGEKCHQQPYEVNVKCGNENTNNIGIDTLIGGTLGVVVGNQIGSGSGKDAAKVIGGIGGALLANNIRNNGCKEIRYKEVCEEEYKYAKVNEIIGFKNCGYAYGQTVCKEDKNKLKYLNIKNTITVY